MNTLDFILLAVVGISGFMAVLRGFLREVLGLVGWISAFILASRFSGELAHYLDHWIHQPDVLNMAAFLLIFLVVLLLFGVLGRLLRHLASQVGLTLTDRFFGLCFGLARGTLIVWIGVVLFQSFSLERESTAMLQGSLLFPYVIQAADWITQQQLPPEWVLTPSTGTTSPIQNVVIPPTHS